MIKEIRIYFFYVYLMLLIFLSFIGVLVQCGLCSGLFFFRNVKKFFIIYCFLNFYVFREVKLLIFVVFRGKGELYVYLILKFNKKKNY